MMTENVHYAEKPDSVIINRVGKTNKCRIDFPVNVTEEEHDETVSYVAEKVYSLDATWTKNLEDRIKKYFDAWFEKAVEA